MPTVFKALLSSINSPLIALQSGSWRISNLHGVERMVRFCQIKIVNLTESLIKTSSVMNQKRDIYNDLQRALEVMRYTDEKTPKNRVFYAMWLLETRSLASGTNIYVSVDFDF